MAAKLLETIYRELHGIGVVQTHAEFCTQWLGRSEGYIRTLRFCAQQPSIDVLAVLSNRLRCMSCSAVLLTASPCVKTHRVQISTDNL